jgi:hypothetical protein
LLSNYPPAKRSIALAVDTPLFGFGFPVAQGLQGHQHHRHANGHVDKEDPSA